MKSLKADGGRNSQTSGAAGSGGSGPLFPRLHVSETEKAGPRAPPRNKMALFEQFTVPSNRFVQPSRTSTAISNQQQQVDYRHPYVGYYTPSSGPYPNVVSPSPQPSHGVSSCVTSSVSDQESQGASRLQTCEKSGLQRSTLKEDGSTKLSYLLKEKAKVVSDDSIPLQSSPRFQARNKQGGFEKLCDKFASASGESAEMPIITNTNNHLQEVTSIVEEVAACHGAESQGCGQDTCMRVNDTVQTKRVAMKSSADARNQHSHGRSSFASDHCQQSDIDHDKVLPEDSMLHINDLTESASSTDLKTSGHREDKSFSPSGNCLVDSAHTMTTNEQLGSLNACEGTHKLCFSDGEKRDAGAGGLSGDGFLKDKGESMEDSQNNHMGSKEVSEHSQQGTVRVSVDSPSSVLAVQAIRPKDVIRAVGQQQFWKARKALLRQQRIFSDQVFQLHKLIQVQQLLAETPGTSIDEEMPFGTLDRRAASPSQSRREHRLDEKTHVTSSFKEQRAKDQAYKTGKQPESRQSAEWDAAVGNDGMGPSPYLPAFSPGGVSAWGYPSLGMGQWMGPMSTQGRPSGCQPFGGAFPPGTPFGGFYGSAVPQRVPFSIPYTGQRSEPWEEMSSNHGPSGPNPQAASAVGHVAHDMSGAWQFVQYNNPYYNQTFYASAPEKNVSTGSGASSINYRWPVNSVHQSENSSPSNTSGSKLKSSPYMRSTPVSRKSGSYHQETEQPAQNINTSSVFRTYSSSKKHEANRAGGGEPSKVAVRCCPKQGDQVPSNNRSAEETFDSGNALDLFPLVPSLSTDGGQSSFKLTGEDWQGRVIKAVPHPAVAASQSAAEILLSLQRERRQ